MEQSSLVLMSLNQINDATILFKKINPTKYIVNCNSTYSFFLVFSETYSTDWVAYVNGKQLPEKDHFVANGFANAWYINTTGTFDIRLEYFPQNYFYLGGTLSLTSIVLITLYLTKK